MCFSQFSPRSSGKIAPVSIFSERLPSPYSNRVPCGTNLRFQDDLQNPDDARIVSRTTEDFIRAEQEHYYEEPVETNGIQKQNGYHRDEDSIYENVGHQTNKTDEKTDQYIDMTLTCPQKEDEPSSVYEDIEEDRTNGPDLTLTDLCESREADSEVCRVWREIAKEVQIFNEFSKFGS